MENKLKSVLADIKEYSLSDSDMKDALNTTKLLTYPQLNKVGHVDEIFDFHGRCILLILTESENVGHWCGVIKKGNKVEFFDPYGNDLSSIETFLNAKPNLNGDIQKLQHLCDDAGYTLVHNPKQLQAKTMGTNTCGRHVVLRLLHHDKPLKQFLKMMKEGKLHPDDKVAIATAHIDD